MEKQLQFSYEQHAASEKIREVFNFARNAHGSQRRKYRDEPYIMHPVRVMETCRSVNASQEVLAAALLHDVLEDTKVDEAGLSHFLNSVFPPDTAARILQLVIELTDVYTKESYPSLNRRARKEKELDRIRFTSKDAQTIKYADILDNAPDTAKYDPGFASKMLQEYRKMLQEITLGDHSLYTKALATVNNCLKMI